MYPRLWRELVLPILRTPGSLRNRLRMVSTERFHASASSEGAKCLSLATEFGVSALNCSLQIRTGTLTETSHGYRDTAKSSFRSSPRCSMGIVRNVSRIQCSSWKHKSSLSLILVCKILTTCGGLTYQFFAVIRSSMCR